MSTKKKTKKKKEERHLLVADAVSFVSPHTNGCHLFVFKDDDVLILLSALQLVRMSVSASGFSSLETSVS